LRERISGPFAREFRNSKPRKLGGQLSRDRGAETGGPGAIAPPPCGGGQGQGDGAIAAGQGPATTTGGGGGWAVGKRPARTPFRGQGRRR